MYTEAYYLRSTAITYSTEDKFSFSDAANYETSDVHGYLIDLGDLAAKLQAALARSSKYCSATCLT